jgi:hypothetical protein
MEALFKRDLYRVKSGGLEWHNAPGKNRRQRTGRGASDKALGDHVAIKKFSDVRLPDQTPIWNETPIANAAPRK